MERRKLKGLVVKLSDGALETLVDLVLFNVFLFGCSFGKGKTSQGAYQALTEASGLLRRFNYRCLRNALAHLKRKGWITALYEGEITTAGRKRLERLLPRFEEKRVWDGSLYLVTYDIPEERRGLRDKLRIYLKRLKMGQLQQSVWITPYNPSKILEEFVRENGLSEGTIVVSKIGKDGFIGKKSLRQFLSDVYGLKEINRRYRQFIKQAKRAKGGDRLRLALRFLAILKSDPQLPWELLPEDWAGREAWEKYKRLRFNA